MANCKPNETNSCQRLETAICTTNFKLIQMSLFIASLAILSTSIIISAIAVVMLVKADKSGKHSYEVPMKRKN